MALSNTSVSLLLVEVLCKKAVGTYVDHCQKMQVCVTLSLHGMFLAWLGSGICTLTASKASLIAQDTHKLVFGALRPQGQLR